MSVTVDPKFRIVDTRHKAWVYLGVELELELVEAVHELSVAEGGGDKKYHRNEKIVLEKKLAVVNDKVSVLEKQMETFKSPAKESK